MTTAPPSDESSSSSVEDDQAAGVRTPVPNRDDEAVSIEQIRMIHRPSRENVLQRLSEALLLRSLVKVRVFAVSFGATDWLCVHTLSCRDLLESTPHARVPKQIIPLLLHSLGACACSARVGLTVLLLALHLLFRLCISLSHTTPYYNITLLFDAAKRLSD